MKELSSLEIFLYSGKKKIHCDRNVVIAASKKKRVSFLSRTHPGKTHDKNVADMENISYPEHIRLYKDTGFQAYEPKVSTLPQPKKAHKKELTAKEKESKGKLSKVRVRVEHALAGIRRSRTVKDTLRNTKEDYSDLVLEIACRLHSLRADHRPRPLRV